MGPERATTPAECHPSGSRSGQNGRRGSARRLVGTDMADHSAGLQPPCSNTGVERVVSRPDWLDLSIPAEDLSAAYRLWSSLSLGPSSMVAGGLHFTGALLSDDRATRLAYGGRGDALGMGSLRVTGSAWAAMTDPEGSLRRLLSLASSRPSRLDLASDFTGAVPAVRELADAFQRHEARTRVRSGRLMRDLATGHETMYLGSEQSPKLLRVYDMRGPVRVEYQARNEAAVVLGMLARVDGCHAAWRAMVGSYVDFPAVRAWGALMSA